MLDLALWCDISLYQNGNPPKDINFNKMRDAGAAGVVIRKTLGKYHDREFERNWQGAGDAGLKRSVYCVPYVRFADLDPQLRAVEEWPSGGAFKEKVDIPAWADIERKHKLSRAVAVERMLEYAYFMVDHFGDAEIYTAKFVFQDFYSRRPGWHSDWGLVVASYRPDLYRLPLARLARRIAEQQIFPAVPEGWLRNKMGNMIPAGLRWEQWQVSADGNDRGAEFGAHSRAIDISFRQGRLDPGSDLREKVLELRQAFGKTEDALTEVEELVGA